MTLAFISAGSKVPPSARVRTANMAMAMATLGRRWALSRVQDAASRGDTAQPRHVGCTTLSDAALASVALRAPLRGAEQITARQKRTGRCASHMIGPGYHPVWRWMPDAGRTTRARSRPVTQRRRCRSGVICCGYLCRALALPDGRASASLCPAVQRRCHCTP